MTSKRLKKLVMSFGLSRSDAELAIFLARLTGCTNEEALQGILESGAAMRGEA